MPLAPATSVDVLAEVSRVVSSITGVQLQDRQRAMVRSRLAQRLAQLGLSDESAYLPYLKANHDTEIPALISLLTTHHTYFFREFSHFEYLERAGLREVVEPVQRRPDKTLRVWSAACSRGHEVYSLAMFLSHHLPKIAPGISFEILGTDIDPESLAIAQNGVYRRDEIKDSPARYLDSHWAKGTGDISHFVKAKASLKSHCRFETQNLIELSKSGFTKNFDLIFCRNIFIYFNSDQTQVVAQGVLNRLLAHGLLFIGISESLNGMKLPVEPRGPSIYSHPVPKVEKREVTAPYKPNTLRVLCVDDSPSIQAMLKRVLTKEQGFEVVATASNGIEAARVLAERTADSPIDAITLDIHMPEQDGVEYLRKNFSDKHPPVVMISSVSRDDAGLALKCFEYGASDYVEKPTLAKMTESGDEIRCKLICAVRARRDDTTVRRQALAVDTAFATSAAIANPEKKLRIVFSAMADREKLRALFRGLSGPQPPTVVFLHAQQAALEAFEASFGGQYLLLDSGPGQLRPGQVYFADVEKSFDACAGLCADRKLSVLVFGIPTSVMRAKIGALKSRQILVEDIGSEFEAARLPAGGSNIGPNIGTDVVPATSFGYMSTEFLAKEDA